VKYTLQGTITISAREDPASGVSVTVADTGIGIPAEHLPHIFERFYRADHSRAIPGAGLGLAIAADIARAHGGSLEASSAAGQDTTFTLRLPQDGQLLPCFAEPEGVSIVSSGSHVPDVQFSR